MIISLIAAMDRRNGIGFQGKIPWHLRADMVRFKELTMDRHVLIGDVTWDGMNREVPGRKVIVLSQDKGAYVPKHTPVFVAGTIPEAIEYAQTAGETELVVAGGQMVYNGTIELANVMYLTVVEHTYTCDRYFPKFDQSLWVTVKEELRCEDDVYFTVMKLVRKEPRVN